jgi:diguanylate cyclase (GGDEF)-like protein
MAWISSDLASLRSIAAATLDDSGVLIEANVGFLRLLKMKNRNPIGARVDSFFIQPDFVTIVAGRSDTNGECYRGLMTVGDYNGKTCTLIGNIRRQDGKLRLVAERDIEELEQLYDTVLELNRNYADAQIELGQINIKLQQYQNELVALSLGDQLTGVGNRRRLEQALEIEMERAGRTGDRLCALMVDLDYFKRVNDNYGHAAGDKVLKYIGALLRKMTRPTDVVSRFGGEEFVVLMPHTTLDYALAAAERIRSAIESQTIEPLPEPITASFGVVELQSEENEDMLLQRVDKALYAAKEAGRNRVVAG